MIRIGVWVDAAETFVQILRFGSDVWDSDLYVQGYELVARRAEREGRTMNAKAESFCRRERRDVVGIASGASFDGGRGFGVRDLNSSP